MMDANIVACSPSTVHRLLSSAGLLQRFSKRPTKKGTGFQQPLAAHDHWHIDVSYLNIRGTFYFCATILDGFSRKVIHWDIRPEMKELDIEAIVQYAKEQYPEARPRIISDNGPQFIANDFKSFVRLSGMTHVRTSPYYKVTEKSNAITELSKVIVFERSARCRSRRQSASSSSSWAITTIVAFTVP